MWELLPVGVSISPYSARAQDTCAFVRCGVRGVPNPVTNGGGLLNSYSRRAEVLDEGDPTMILYKLEGRVSESVWMQAW